MKDRSVFLFILLTGFLALTLIVSQNLTRSLDLAVMKLIQSYVSTELDYGLYFFTILGSPEFSCFAVLTVCWYFYRKYEWSGSFLYLFFFVVLSGVEFLWKHYVTYTGPGPEFDRNLFHWGLVSVSTPYGFPSGHTFRCAFILGMWYQRLNMREGGISLNVLLQKVWIVVLLLGTGYSRIYLGDHWLSDVIGGYLLAAIGILLAQVPRERELRPA